MIADSMENLTLYRGLGANMDAAITWLESTRLDELQPGTVQIQGEAIRAIVQEYRTVPEAGRQYEAHRRFIDIQCVASGVERMLAMPVSGLDPAGPYDEEKDVVFFDAPALAPPANAQAGRAELVVPAGAFAVFFSEDAHMPMVQAGSEADVKKVVVKVGVEKPLQ